MEVSKARRDAFENFGRAFDSTLGQPAWFMASEQYAAWLAFLETNHPGAYVASRCSSAMVMRNLRDDPKVTDEEFFATVAAFKLLTAGMGPDGTT